MFTFNKLKNIIIQEYKQLTEIDWKEDFSDVKHKCMPLENVLEYLNKIRANADKDTKEREKFNKELPFVHSKSKLFNNEQGIKVVDVKTFINQITKRPKFILSQNEKMKKTGKHTEYTFNTGIPAFRGIVYDIENKKFEIINTCPGAGSCVIGCYAMSGQYIRYSAAYDKMTRVLNYLMNYPDKYEEQLYTEIKKKAIEYKAFKGYKSLIKIRWNDSGDFFSKKMLTISENIIKRLKQENYNIESGAHTKIASVLDSEEISTSFSTDANKREIKRAKLYNSKNSDRIPKNLSIKLDLDKLSDEEEYLKRISKYFNLDPNFVITYDELMSLPKGNEPKWFVVVTNKDGDDALYREDVKRILHKEH